ncbi:hypothetical protein [Streptodolium elevatio]
MILTAFPQVTSYFDERRHLPVSLPPELTAALRHFRAVRAQRPDGDHAEALAAWYVAKAEALEALSLVLLFDSDRASASASAATACAEAERIRRLI